MEKITIEELIKVVEREESDDDENQQRRD